MTKYGNTRAARAMEQEDRERDLLKLVISHLAENPMEDPFLQADSLMALRKLDRRDSGR